MKRRKHAITLTCTQLVTLIAHSKTTYHNDGARKWGEHFKWGRCGKNNMKIKRNAQNKNGIKNQKKYQLYMDALST